MAVAIQFKAIGLLLLTVLLSYKGFAKADIQCEERADIIFLLDSSASIRNSAPPPSADPDSDNWQLIIDFVVQVVTGLPVENGDVRVAALTYGTEVDRDNIIDFEDYKSKDDLMAKVNTLPYIGSNTNTAAAIKRMQRMFRNSVRGRTRRVAILISDGMSDIDHDDTLVNARDAKMEDDVNIFTLGVTKYANVGELEELASDPAAYYHFYSSDFQHLNLLLDQLLMRLCTPRPPAVGCTDLVADVTLLIDSSGSIKDKAPEENRDFYWNHLKAFAMKIVERLEISQEKTRVAVVRFASTAKKDFYLEEFNSAKGVLEKIESAEHLGGKTNTSGALRVMRKEIYRESRGDRSDVIDIGIIITDGESTVDQDRTEYEASRLKEKNIRMFAVGVTNRIDRTELETIVSEPVPDHFFNTSRFEDIDDLVSRLVWRVCHEQCVLGENDSQRCTPRTTETVCPEGQVLHWIKFSDHLLVGYNYARIDHVESPGECQRLCIEDARCRSVDYVTTFQECAVSYVTKDEDPRRFAAESGVDYYEWICWDGTGDPDQEPGKGSPAAGTTLGAGDVRPTVIVPGSTTKGKGKGKNSAPTTSMHWALLLLSLFSVVSGVATRVVT